MMNVFRQICSIVTTGNDRRTTHVKQVKPETFFFDKGTMISRNAYQSRESPSADRRPEQPPAGDLAL
jgi:hypothetical protein